MPLFLMIAFLFPVALYLSVLAAINRRTQPLLISGTWDFAALLFGLSGFILVTGPVMASIFYREKLALFFLRGGGQAFPDWISRVFLDRVVYWGMYYGGIVAGAVALLWWRRRSTVIYNIRPEMFDTVFFPVLDRQHCSYVRQGNRVYLSNAKGQGTLDAEQAEQAIIGAGTGVPLRVVAPHADDLTAAGQAPPTANWVTVEPFSLSCNVTLYWHGPNANHWREPVEQELSKVLATVYTEENPAAGWLMGISGLLFLVMIFSMALVIGLALLFPR